MKSDLQYLRQFEQYTCKNKIDISSSLSIYKISPALDNICGEILRHLVIKMVLLMNE